MATITEDHVSFEIAKLLKEKGFNERCFSFYWPDGSLDANSHDKTTDLRNSKTSTAVAPTLQMAMKWLRERYNIYISIQPDFPNDKDYKMCWCCSVNILHEDCISTKWYQCYIETYEKACEAAIKYCLENLI